MIFAVLRALSACEFRSGEALAERLGISRASVHNAVMRGRALGLGIHAVRGRGYRLTQELDWLDCARLARWGEARGWIIDCVDVIDSTNSRLLAWAARGDAHRRALAAEWQSAGRGRRGRRWLSVPGESLTFSVLWRFARPLTALSGLSLAVGLALRRALERFGVEGVRLKWPNDLLLAEGKLAGILIETQGDVLSGATAIIGIGLNVRASPALRAQASGNIAALSDDLARLPTRTDLLLAILDALEAALVEFDAAGFAPFAAEWMQAQAWGGRQVQLLEGGRVRYHGTLAGVDAFGQLLLDTPAGRVAVHSGELSLRPQS